MCGWGGVWLRGNFVLGPTNMSLFSIIYIRCVPENSSCDDVPVHYLIHFLQLYIGNIIEGLGFPWERKKKGMKELK